MKSTAPFTCQRVFQLTKLLPCRHEPESLQLTPALQGQELANSHLSECPRINPSPPLDRTDQLKPSLLRTCLLDLLSGVGDNYLARFLGGGHYKPKEKHNNHIYIPKLPWLSKYAFEVLCYKSH